MISIAICDDNEYELSNLTELVDSYKLSNKLSIKHTAFTDGFELISALEKGKLFDLYCLDIILLGLNGIDLAKEIRDFDKAAPILFFTSSPEFALESYNVDAVSYLIKPVSTEKLFAAFDKALDRMKIMQDDSIIVKSKKGIQKIFISNIVFAEVFGKNVVYHLLSGKVVETIEVFSDVCKNLLEHKFFLKTHRVFVVNMNFIDAIENNQITLQNRVVIPIAQGKTKEIKGQYLDYQMQEEV